MICKIDGARVAIAYVHTYIRTYVRTTEEKTRGIVPIELKLETRGTPLVLILPHSPL